MAATTSPGSPSAKQPEREVVLTRVFDAPREIVFKAWIDPQQLRLWWGPKGFTNPVCESDAQVGGTRHIVIRSPDGTDYSGVGKYREIAEPERIVFTNTVIDSEGNAVLDGLTDVEFAEQEGKTKLTLRTRAVALVPYAAAYLAGMEAGWEQTLERLAEMLAKS
jgi:uncharacterized protein YndB with AHSA1/START domain